jgi:predicted regulator of Ras-like GTPase activity (Roadblock/LC7/MglB family)
MSAPSNGVKNGFFGYIKGLFRKNENGESNQDNFETAEVTPLPLVPPPVEIAHARVAAPVLQESAPAPSPATYQNDNVDSQDGGVAPSVGVPLQPIIDGLNNDIRSRVRVKDVGDTMINLALEKVLPQLAQGQVRVPFGDVRKSAPQFFSTNVDYDRISVSVPLNEILSRLNPALLVRRTANRVVEVPEEITSPFSGRGEGLSLGAEKPKPAAPTVAPRKSAPAQSAPAPVSFAPLKQPTSPHVPTSTDVPENVFSFTKSPAAAPAQQKQSFAPAPAQTAPIQFKPQPAAPVPAQPAGPAITLPISVLSETWPQAVRLEIAQSSLAQSQVGLPVDAVEASLKRGRVVFNWKTIRSWVRPATPGVVSAHDAVELELPLKVIAPLFLARKQSVSSPANRTAVDEAIPNIFFGFPQPETASAPAIQQPPAAPSLIQSTPPPAAPAPAAFGLAPSQPAPTASLAAATTAINAAAASAAAAAATVSAAANKIADTNYYLWEDASETQMLHIQALKQKGTSSTEFTKRYSSPNEIVARAASLQGVTGVLVALPDGLMVASKLPAEFNGDTLAALLPQIYAKVSSCTKELRMGDLNNVSFTVGNTPWKIFRVNAIFFAAFGTAGQPMPTSQLASLAGELDRKSK